MLKNYLTVAFRTLRRHKGYTFINVLGLAVGIACCLLIALFVRDELSYDRFHEKSDRIYRVARSEGDLKTSGALAPALVAGLPEVEHALRFSKRWGSVLVRRGERAYHEDRFFFADSTTLEVFTFPLVQGNAATALDRPFTVVLTESTARKYFGGTDVVGQTVNIEGPWGAHNFEVTGVARDLPTTTHLHWDLLASFSTRRLADYRPEHIDLWGYVGDHTYVLLREGASPEAVEAKIPAVLAQYEDQPLTFYERALQPLPDLYLHHPSVDEFEPTGDPRYLWIFSCVALIIFVIACINYTNLATAWAAHRAREVGVRKVMGAAKAQLVRQFMSESVLLSLLALGPALLLVWIFLPLLNQITGKAIVFASGVDLLPIAVASVVLVGLVSGLYPAFFLSAFRPVTVLKGRHLGEPKRAWLRSGLIVFQFAAVVALMASTLVVQQQLDFVQQQRLGLDKEQVVVVDARRGMEQREMTAFKEALTSHPGIVTVAGASSLLPADAGSLPMALWPEGVPREAHSGNANTFSAEPGFIETLGIELIEGEPLRTGHQPEGYTPVLINEAAVQEFGWDEPIGKTFTCCFRPIPKVIGVVADFNYESLKERVEPVVIMGSRSARFFYVRIRPENISGTMDHIDEAWAKSGPGTAMEYSFLDARFDALYKADRRLAQVFSVFSALAVLLTCLGLFGLVAFSAQQRTKEIGIRKVLGATAGHIVLLLSRRFARLILIGFVVGAPLSWWVMNLWLQDFAYRVELGPGVFVLAGAAALLIALLTVSYQAIKAARADPVQSLRAE